MTHILIRRTPPTPRPGIYELYWTFASRRQAIFEARLSGKSRPWTQDRILQTFKFCNVYRAADRVSQYMIGKVAADDAWSSPADRLFRIVAFRTFSKIATWEGLRRSLGNPTIEHLRSGAFEDELDAIKREEGGLYTGAFILCANKAFGFDEKHRNHVALFKKMFVEDRLDARLLEARSLGAVVALLESYPLIGPFMPYQTAIDLNYSDLFDFSENDFTQAGPGALRGIRKAFSDIGDFTPQEAILWMTERQSEEFARLDLPFHGLFGRALHAIDCQGLFCELDKYCREAAPELHSERSRIKARYTASPDPITLAFPKKWELSVEAAFLPAPARDQEDQKTLELGDAPLKAPSSPRSSRAKRDDAPVIRDLFAH